MTHRRFVNQVVIVTGAAQGMGASHVRGFAREGAIVLAGDVNDAAGQELADELGGSVHYRHLDVTRAESWDDIVAQAVGLGPVTALVNNAGVVGFGSLHDRDQGTWSRVVAVNQTGTWLGMASVTEAMKEHRRGAIVNVSSSRGLTGRANMNAYVGSKWAVRGMTKAAALELGEFGIRVNSIHPGPIRTPMLGGREQHLPTQALQRLVA